MLTRVGRESGFAIRCFFREGVDSYALLVQIVAQLHFIIINEILREKRQLTPREVKAMDAS